MAGRGAWVIFFVILGGCTSERVELLLDLETDLVPGVEVTLIRTERFDHLPRTEERAAPEHTRERRAERGERWDAPIRIAELTNLEPGRHYVRVRLLTQGDGPVLQRIAALTVRETSIFTITMTRDCRGVMCPVSGDDPTATECVGGRCGTDECTDETPEHCPMPACTEDADCTARSACATARCSSGACLSIADDATCATDEWCSPDGGCTQETHVITGAAGGSVDPYELVVAPGGDVTIAGAVIGAVDFGAGALPAPPSRGMMIAAYTAELAPLWGHVYAASSVTESRALARHPDGTTIAAGYFLGSGSFGATMVAASDGQDAVLLGHDAAGALTLVETYPTVDENAQGRGLSIAADGAIAIAGVYGVDVTIGGVTLPAVPGSATDWGFVAVVDPPSVARWVVHLPGAVSVLADDAAFLSDGGVCAVGRFDVDVTAAGVTHPTQGGYDGFVVRVDAGTVTWARAFGGPGADSPYAAVALGDACVVVGQIEDGAVFDDVVAETRGGSDGFVARYDATGAVEWVTVLGGAGTDYLWSAAPGPGSTVLVGGSFAGMADFGGESLVASASDGLVAGIAGDGTVRWARGLGGDGDEIVSAVGYDFETDRVAIAVRFSGATRVGRHEVTSLGMRDSFVHWLTP